MWKLTKKTLSTMRYASWLSRFLTILHIDIKTPLKLIPQASKWSIKTFKSFPSHRWDYLHFKSLSKQQVVPKTLQSANVSSSAILRKQKDNKKNFQPNHNSHWQIFDRKIYLYKKTLENLLMDIIGKTLKVQNTQKTFLKHISPKQEQNQFQPQNNIK